MRSGLLFYLGVVLALIGCGDENALGQMGDNCSRDGVGCSPGFSCVPGEEQQFVCVPDAQADATQPADDQMPMADAMPTEGDAATPQPDAMAMMPDGAVDNGSVAVDAGEADAALPDAMTAIPDSGLPDVDGDGAADGADNCPDVANADQTDSDNDGLGDACDVEPNVQNFIMTGHFLTLGGAASMTIHTLKSKITTGAGESTDGQLIMTGEIRP